MFEFKSINLEIKTRMFFLMIPLKNLQLIKLPVLFISQYLPTVFTQIELRFC